MKHFVTDDGLNTFRLPVGWQYLVDTLGGTLNANHWATYDKQIQGCLDAGAEMCIVDVHNYGRWNGAIVGQGGPTDVQFASLWSQIAAKYKGNAKIAFGVMNEPVSLSTENPASNHASLLTLHLARCGHQELGCHRSGRRYRHPQGWCHQEQDSPSR